MQRSPTLPELRFVVVGAEAAGKSTFIYHALDLRRPLQQPVATKKMSLEGQVFMISLTEVQLADVSVDDDYLVSWPRLGDTSAGRVDGVLTLYDVSRRETLLGIPDLLNACAKANLPCVLVACKCDLPSNCRRIDPREIEKSCMKETGIEGCQTYLDQPETHKRCISVVLRNVISNESAWRGGNRARASTGAKVNSKNQGRENRDHRSSHTRAASERVVPSTAAMATHDELDQPLTFRANHASDAYSGPAPGYLAPDGTGFPQAMVEREVESEPETPQKDAGDEDSGGKQKKPENDGGGLPSRPRSRIRPGSPIMIANSLIDGEGESSSDSEDEPLQPVRQPPETSDASTEGYSFAELVDRLISLPMTADDYNFKESFLCLYRKFAAPAALLAALIQRWESLREEEDLQILMLHSQLRLVALMARWVALYPGDLAYPLTRQYLLRFCERLADNRLFATAASEMLDVIESPVPDDDASWSISDSKVGEETVRGYFRDLPELIDSVNMASSADWFETIEDPGMGSDIDHESLGQRRLTSSTTSGWSGDRSASFSVGSFSTMLDSVEAAKAQAELLTPLSRAPLTKIQWRQFMEYPDDELASELTRMDWIMYTALQPRDLIRHVSLSPEQREKCRSLDHLNRMINHFNHISFWTASMILLRDKAKHRAKAIEKFIEVARKLRLQNNYNSLAAIVAGINGTAVHRLVQTHELVAQSSQKEFMKFGILMSARRGYFAYRLAWGNTLGEKVPFLPLHLRDLVATEEGNPTFLGKNKDRINWKKFSIMSDTVINIQESQGRPYPYIPRNAEMQRLILDGRISMDGEELYDRSIQVESRGPNEPRRRFNLFQR